jgi:hypothetical protein
VKDPIVIGVATILAILMTPVLIWAAMALVATDHCAWIAGYGGCLPR